MLKQLKKPGLGDYIPLVLNQTLAMMRGTGCVGSGRNYHKTAEAQPGDVPGLRSAKGKEAEDETGGERELLQDMSPKDNKGGGGNFPNLP